MQVLTNRSFALVIALGVLTAGASAEPFFDTFPERFPGSADFPAPAEPVDLPPAYPEWPEPPARREIVPPPPPGPYMSSALSEVDSFPADPGGLRYEPRPEEQIPSPFFETDTLWPEVPERGRPTVWMPETGEYRFVPDEVVRQLEAPVRRRQPRVYPPYPGYMPSPPVQQRDYGYR